VWVQILAQHRHLVDRQDKLKLKLKSASTHIQDVHSQKEQVVLDKLQLEAKLNWMMASMQREETAYRIIKKNFRPMILKFRVLKLLCKGDAKEFRLKSKMRDCKVVDMVHLLGNYGKQLQVLYEIYCVPMEFFFEAKAYGLMDPNGFQLRAFKEYKHAVHQMALLFKQVENDVSAAISQFSEQLRQPIFIGR
jgi:hypothetical protein